MLAHIMNGQSRHERALETISHPKNTKQLFALAYVALAGMACIENRSARLAIVGGLLLFGLSVREQTIASVRDIKHEETISATTMITLIAVARAAKERADQEALLN